MRLASILHISTQLILPVDFLSCQGFMVTILHLFYKLNWYTWVATPLAAIMVTKSPILFFDFLFVITMTLFEWGGTFSNILASTFLTSTKIDKKGTVSVQSLSNWIGPLCVSACKFIPLLHNRTGNPAPATLETSWFLITVFSFIFLCDYPLQIFGLTKAHLNIVTLSLRFFVWGFGRNAQCRKKEFR